MQILDGKVVAENIKENFEERIKNLKTKPNIAVLGIKGDEASDVYIKRIGKNCEKYEIGFNLMMAETEEEFKANFEKIKNDEKTTGIMFQEPLSKELSNLINEIPSKKDIEGVSHENMGKLFVGEKDAIAPCTSKAVIEVFDYYNIDLTGKKVVVVGRSNIVGKPLIPQLLQKNATVTICHSKTLQLLLRSRAFSRPTASLSKWVALSGESLLTSSSNPSMPVKRSSSGQWPGVSPSSRLLRAHLPGAE